VVKNSTYTPENTECRALLTIGKLLCAPLHFGRFT